MRPVNGFFLFELGSVVLLTALPANADLRPSLLIIGEIAGHLRSFVNEKANQQDLPDSVDIARQILTMLETLVGKSPPTLTDDEKLHLGWTIGRLHDRLSTDLPKVFSFVLEGKRGRSVPTLWRTPLEFMATDAVPLLSDFVKKNLEEASKCLVLDRPTAAGFHAMRSVECVARKYYELVTGRPTEWKEQDGKPRFKMFGGIAQELQDKAESRQRKPESNGDLELIAGILKPLCRLYRDPLSHSELRDLEEDEAMTAFNQGLDVIAKAVLDAKKGGAHFEKSWVAGSLF